MVAGIILPGGFAIGVPALALPALPFPVLPPLGIPGLPSGISLQTPGALVNQPGIPTSPEVVAQSVNAFNAMVGQIMANPVALISAPISVPTALGQQMAAKLQAGTVQPRTTNVTTALSGAFTQLQPAPTNILEGQLYNAAPSAIGVTTGPIGSTTPDKGSVIPVPAGGTFNFGPIDLSTIFIGNISNNNAVQVVLYIEQ
jgi:hypothetical protein